jgi:uncharacterized phage-associated protein
MAKVDDVAAAILARQGRMETWRLQKLVYYCQAWHLAWENTPLFPNRIEAWANGPVVPALYAQHRGQYEVRSWNHGDPGNLTAAERETIDAVLKKLGPKSGAWLSALTHREQPWRNARKGLGEGERGQREITKEAMAEYYGSLL